MSNGTPRWSVQRLAGLVICCLVLAACAGSATSELNTASGQSVDLDGETAPSATAPSASESTSEPPQPTPSPTTQPAEAAEPAEPAQDDLAEAESTIDFDAIAEFAVELEHDPGWEFSPDLTRKQILSVLSTTMGPTTDVGATVSRLLPLPYDVFTLPDSNVVAVEVDFRRSFVFEWELVRSVELTIVTSAAREDAALTYATELSSLGFEIDDTEQIIATVVHSEIYAADRLDDERTNLIEIDIVDRVEGGSIVEFSYREIGGTDISPAEIVDQWHRPSPLPDDLVLNSFGARVGTSPGGNHLIWIGTSLASYEPSEDPDGLLAEMTPRLEENRYVLDRVEPNILRVFFGNAPTNIAAFGPRSSPETYGYLEVLVNQEVVLEADSPVPPATPGLGLDSDDSDTGASTGALLFAEPNGSVITADMSAVEIERLLVELMAPTNDISATVARIGPFAAGMPTMPDARVTSLRSGLRLGSQSEPDERLAHHSVWVTYLTSASYDDAVLAHETQLAAAGWRLERSTSDETFAGTRTTLVFDGAPEIDPGVDTPTFMYLSARNVAALTVEVEQGEDDFRTITLTIGFVRPDDVSGFTMYDGWFATSPFPEGGIPVETSISASQSRSDRVSVITSTTRRYVNSSLDELRVQVRDGLDVNSDWSILEDHEYEADDRLFAELAGLADEVSFVLRPDEGGFLWPDPFVDLDLEYSRIVLVS